MRQTIEQYILAIIWYVTHFNNSNENKKDFYYAANRIGRLEDDLRTYGASEETIIALQDKARKVIATPIDKFSTDMQLKLSKVVFGGLTKWAI